MGKLTDAKLRYAKATEDTHLSDGDGLALRIYPKRGRTAKTWIFRYRQPGTGKQTKFPLGDYPALTLSGAREVAATARKQLAEGVEAVNP